MFESSAITCCVSNEELWGSSPETAAQVVQWESFASSHIVAPVSSWVFPTLGIMHHRQATKNSKQEVRRILGLPDAYLDEPVTLAGITVVCTLL